MNSLLRLSVQDYAAKLASAEPVPGGGGVAALVSALGMALGSMVGNLTSGKKKYIAVQPQVDELLAHSEQLRQKLMSLSDADAEVFLPLSRAYGLPSKTDEERAAKNAVIEPALLAAANVPLEIGRSSVEALRLLARYAEVGSQIAISDAACGAALVRAGLVAAQFNVAINTRLMRDRSVASKLDQEISKLVTEGEQLADDVLRAVWDSLSPR